VGSSLSRRRIRVRTEQFGIQITGEDTGFFRVRYRCPPDVIAANAELVQRDGVPVLDRHLDRLEVCVHGHVHACDCAVNLNN